MFGMKLASTASANVSSMLPWRTRPVMSSSFTSPSSPRTRLRGGSTPRAGFIEYGHQINALKHGGRYYDDILMVKFLEADVAAEVTGNESFTL
jgi:hypothetical protein